MIVGAGKIQLQISPPPVLHAHCPPLPLLLLDLMHLLALITLPTTAPPATPPPAIAGLDHTSHHCPSFYSTSSNCWP